MADERTIDWVTEATGEEGGHVCDRHGHVYEIDGPVDIVHECAAAFLRCRVCGRRGYYWLPRHVRSSGGYDRNRGSQG